VSRRSRVTFVRFCVEVLHLDLTSPVRVLVAVCIDGVQPGALEGEDREVARTLFGDVEEIDPRLRRILVWRLGRASGKTTIAAALLLYVAWTSDLSRSGRGQVPAGFIVSPTRTLAKICQNIARELARSSELEPFVESDTTSGFLLRRPDRRLVEIASVAASKGGANLRGRDVVVLVLDESEFFASNEDGGADGYSVTDKDQISAVMPRLIGHVVCISTPWPTDNVTAEYFDRNHGRPTDAVAALGTSMFMRPTEQLAEDITREMERDEENALREYECVAGARGGSRLFDLESIRAAINEDRPLVIRAPPGAHVGAGGDLAFERDSSAIAVCSRIASGEVELLEFDEVRPARGAPLSPGYVVRDRFAPVMRRHGVRTLWADAHYRQSAIEHLIASNLVFADAPPGSQGKYDVYLHTRGLLRAGQLRLPNAPKLIAQLRAVTATPLPQKGTKITSPRRAGSGHGDIVSALTLSCWALRVDHVAAQRRAVIRGKVAGLENLWRHMEATTPEQIANLRSEDQQKAMERRHTSTYQEKVAAERKRSLEKYNEYLGRIGSPAYVPPKKD
jgi:hypothetical protein